MFKMQHAATGKIVYANRNDMAYWTAAGYRFANTAWL